MAYKTILIDPRPQVKESMIEMLKDHAPTMGVEFTLPDLAKYLIGNIDDQHVEGAVGRAAIEVALEVELPPANTTLAIVRPDADAIGAVAVLNMRARGIEFGQTIDRIQYIAALDKWARGPWYPRAYNEYSQRDIFAGLNKLCMNFKTPIGERIESMEDWVSTGSCAGLLQAIDDVKQEERACFEHSTLHVDGNIAIVDSAYMGATNLAYSQAPVGVIKNDSFRFAGGKPHVKYTVCQYGNGYVDMKAIIADLNAIETEGTWGGSPTIAGSPQGVSSSISSDVVVEIVKRHLI